MMSARRNLRGLHLDCPVGKGFDRGGNGPIQAADHTGREGAREALGIADRID